jgi:hypothetical protein
MLQAGAERLRAPAVIVVRDAGFLQPESKEQSGEPLVSVAASLRILRLLSHRWYWKGRPNGLPFSRLKRIAKLPKYERSRAQSGRLERRVRLHVIHTLYTVEKTTF